MRSNPANSGHRVLQDSDRISHDSVNHNHPFPGKRPHSNAVAERAFRSIEKGETGLELHTSGNGQKWGSLNIREMRRQARRTTDGTERF